MLLHQHTSSRAIEGRSPLIMLSLVFFRRRKIRYVLIGQPYQEDIIWVGREACWESLDECRPDPSPHHCREFTRESSDGERTETIHTKRHLSGDCCTLEQKPGHAERENKQRRIKR